MPDEDDIPRMRDELVEAFFAGDTDRVNELGQSLIDTGLKEGDSFALGDELTSGTLLEPAQIPEDIDDIHMLEGDVSAERLEQLANRAPLTPEEAALLQDRWVWCVLQDITDFDTYAIWGVHEAKHTVDGRTIYTARVGRGYAFTGLNIEFMGAFAALDEAYDALKLRGYISYADYEARHPGTGRTARPGD
jgi:hypothetical protein